MTVRVGVIGAGVMGSDHARIFRTSVSGATLAVVADQDAARARAAAGNGARVTDDAFALVRDADVDAVVIASPDATHADLVLAALAEGKPVLCEKPLATSTADCLRIVEAEAATGRKLVHTGFMRRFDPTYRAIKADIDGGALGAARLVHNQHRNQSAPGWFTDEMILTNSFVHEIDISRWLLGADFVAATVTAVGRSAGGASDHLMIVLEADSGAVVATEMYMNCGYGYHVHCEVVCTSGTSAMAEPALHRVRHANAARAAYPENWIPRFADAYRIQAQAFVDAIGAGGVDADAASAWDGLVATTVAEQVGEALRSGGRGALTLPPR